MDLEALSNMCMVREYRASGCGHRIMDNEIWGCLENNPKNDPGLLCDPFQSEQKKVPGICRDCAGQETTPVDRNLNQKDKEDKSESKETIKKPKGSNAKE